MISPDDSMRGRVIALAAVFQAVEQVRRLAENGTYDEASTRPMIQSVLRVDAPDAISIYGNRHALSAGLAQLRSMLTSRWSTENPIGKMAFSILQLERNLAKNPTLLDNLRKRIDSAQILSNAPMHELMAELGKAYADIISGQKPSVIVTGNPQYLDRREIVTEIRALLLAALRGAVLWRQMGGNMLDCLIRRKAMLRAMDSL